jgi:dTDP-4-amino-4,6-dideoxygalactose transaminase
VRNEARHVYHIYSTRTTKRQEWQDALNAKGIQTGIHYPIAIHLLPAWEDLGLKRGDFPHAERAAAEQLSLPMFAEITPEMQERVAAAVIELHKASELAR